MAEYQAQDTDLVFALDIGTRSVVGVVGRTVGDRLKILGIEMEEHKSRAMMDGQIDNIQQVADLARIVTERLERQLEVHLEKVCVAAAGRALRTQSGTFALELPDGQAITPEQISQLETGAVSAAEAALQMDEENRRQFFLVGYTVAQYRLTDIHYPPCWGMAVRPWRQMWWQPFCPERWWKACMRPCIWQGCPSGQHDARAYRRDECRDPSRAASFESGSGGYRRRHHGYRGLPGREAWLATPW